MAAAVALMDDSATDGGRCGGVGVADGDRELLGGALDVVEWFDQQQPAGVHDGDDVGDAFDFADLMAGEEDGAAGGGDVDHAFEKFAADHGVEAGGRFVEDEELGLVGHGEGEGDFGAHAFGELAELAVEGDAKAGDERAEVVLEAVGIEAGGEPADFGDGHPLVERGSFGEVADAAADFEAGGAAIEAEDADVAGGGVGEAEHESDGGGFAGAVFAEQREDNAGRDGERDVVEGGVAAEGLGDAG